ncbi:MAG: toll/interleukin-1 receptor domain-containing protein [Chloroflexi bacterium]|nr:toll/interleukin-1 receptor domain-containing protein [Chloroflexota bacterium]
MRSQPDTFICHASEDKAAIARPLHQALTDRGVHSWLDESEIRLGQSIRRRIDDGLANCRSATVILSRSFFAKNWVQYEMDGLVGRAMQKEILLFPIQHGITLHEIRDHSPPLAGLSLWNTSDFSPEAIADEITAQLSNASSATSGQPAGPIPVDVANPAPARKFGIFYIANAETPELALGADPGADARIFSFNAAELEDWIPALANGEELEYILDGYLLCVQLNWGNTLRGPEIAASHKLSGGDPFALTIRNRDGSQLYFPVAVNPSPSSWISASRSGSGWMTFRIG